MLVLFIILTPNAILEKTVADTIIAPRFTVDIANPQNTTFPWIPQLPTWPLLLQFVAVLLY